VLWYLDCKLCIPYTSYLANFSSAVDCIHIPLSSDIVDTSSGIHSRGKQLSLDFLDDEPGQDGDGSFFKGFGMLPFPVLHICCNNMLAYNKTKEKKTYIMNPWMIVKFTI